MRGWLFAALLLSGAPALPACVDATDSLNDMAAAELTLAGPAGRYLTLPVRVADDARERSAGFQHICPGTIDTTSIYFVFDRVRRPSFHMRNVWAPLDIAFVDREGVIVDIQHMEPYIRGSMKETFYSPPGKVAAALETRAGFFSEQHLTAGDWRIESLKQ